MKVIHIITRLDPGGSSEAVLIVCQHLMGTKYTPILIYGGERKYQFQFKSFQVRHLIRNISPMKDLLAFLKIRRIIKQEKPSIVHTHTSKAGFLGRLAALSAGIRNIVHTPHGHVFYGYFNPVVSFLIVILERFVSVFTKKLIALTEGEMRESISYGVGNYKKWTIIPSPVEVPNKIYNTQEGKKTLTVGTVARLEPVKGVRYLIDAIPFVLNEFKNVNFMIVGDGTQRKSLELRARKLGINGYVTFTGLVSDVMEYISRMDIYVQPSLNEGMGKSIVQAGYLSKPIIATSVQGIKSVIKHGYSGLLVSPKNPEELAKAILLLLKDENLRTSLGRNAMASMMELVNGYPKYSIERVMKALCNLYDTISIKS